MLRSGLEVYGPPTASRLGSRRRRGARADARRTAARCSRSRAAAKGVALRSGMPGRRAAVRARARVARAEPARPAAAAAGRAGERALRSAVLAAAPRRRRARDGRRDRAPARRPVQRRRPGRGHAVAGGAPRRPRPVARCCRGCGARSARASEVAGAALAPHVVDLIRHGCTGDGSRARDELGPRPTSRRPRTCCASSSTGPTSCRSRPAGEQVA